MKNVSDKMLESVVKQALKFSDWNVAYQWIEENVPAAQLEHARAFVRSREAAQQQPAEPPIEAVELAPI